MFRKLLFTMAALVVLPAAVSAQSEDVNVTATVDFFSSITGAGDLAFGTLSRTVDNVIDPTSGGALRTVNFNADVTVSFSGVPATLAGPNGASLPVSLTCAYDQGGVWSAAVACNGNSFDITNTNATGVDVATLGFGGTITAAAVQAVPAGSYTGTFTIQVVAQ